IRLGNATATRMVDEPETEMRLFRHATQVSSRDAAFEKRHEYRVAARERRAVARCAALTLGNHQPQKRGLPGGKRRRSEYGNVARHRDPVARLESPERSPSVDLPEGMVGGRANAKAGTRAQLEYRLTSLRNESRDARAHGLPAVEADRLAARLHLGDGDQRAADGVDDARVSRHALPETNREHIARNPEILDGARQRERIRRNDADVAGEVDERLLVEVLRIDDRRVDVGEDLEFARAADVVAVARRPVRHDLVAIDRAHLPRLERVDHPVRLRHAADPLVGLDAHDGIVTLDGTIGRTDEASIGEPARSGVLHLD